MFWPILTLSELSDEIDSKLLIFCDAAPLLIPELMDSFDPTLLPPRLIFSKLPVGDAVDFVSRLPSDPLELCVDFKLSDFANFLPNSSAIKSDDLENLFMSFFVLMSNESDDFWRKISDGLMFRSRELEGELSESFRPGDDERTGTVGGSTGAARRGNFGGGLEIVKKILLYNLQKESNLELYSFQLLRRFVHQFIM